MPVETILEELDFRSHTPIYLQIVDRIEHLVASGILKAGEQLPTVRQLAADLRVNFNTVARAYRMLDEAGLISTQQGRGTYVLEQPPPESAEALRQRTLDGMAHTFLAEAERLGFTPEEVKANLQRWLERWKSEGQVPEEIQPTRSEEADRA